MIIILNSLLALALAGLMWDIYLRLHPKPSIPPETVRVIVENLNPITLREARSMGSKYLEEREINAIEFARFDIERQIANAFIELIRDHIEYEEYQETDKYLQSNTIVHGNVKVWIKPLKTKGQ